MNTTTGLLFPLAGSVSLALGSPFLDNGRTYVEKRATMLKIDIDSLSEKELIELNHKIVARLRFLH